MSDARRRDAWGHTSSLLAMLHNNNCTDKNKLAQPSDFNPLIRKKPKAFNPRDAAARLAAHIVRTGG